MRLQKSIFAGVILSALCITSYAVALECGGEDPHWSLDLDSDFARYSYRGKAVDFEIPHVATPVGRETPVAYTLVSDFDSAILLVDAPNGVDKEPITALLMTQDRSLPIMLSGNCKATQ